MLCGWHPLVPLRRAQPATQFWKCVPLELSELEAAARSPLFSSLSCFLFLVVPVDLKPPESHFLLGGGWRLVFCLALFPFPSPFGKPACKQVEAWSLNVSDSEPEVGSASAGQTSFAGVERRGEGVKLRWDI